MYLYLSFRVLGENKSEAQLKAVELMQQLRTQEQENVVLRERLSAMNQKEPG